MAEARAAPHGEPRRRASPLPVLAAASAATAVGLLVVVPIGRLIGVAISGGTAGLEAALGRASLVAIVGTAWTSAAVVVLAVTLGTLAALALHRLDLPARRVLRVALLMPLLTPPFVAALGWVQAYAPEALTDDLFGVSAGALFGPAGIVAVLVVSAVPLVLLVVGAALEDRVEPDLELAARVSGAGRVAAFRTVTAPLLRPALLAASVLVFVTSINAFGVPAVLGIPAGFTTITTRIYQDLVFSADDAVFVRVIVLACLLAAVGLVVVGVVDTASASTGRSLRTGTGSGSARRSRGRAARVAAAILVAYVALTTLVPLLGLVVTALTRAVGLAPVPENLTLDNFAAAVGPRTGGAVVRSIGLAIAAASLTLLLSGIVVALGRRRGSRAVTTAATLMFALPGSTVAVAVLVAYGGLLRDTLAIILLAYLAKLWAVALRPVAGSVERLPHDLLYAARASGAGPGDALRSVAIPLLRPTIVAAWLLVFLFGVHELTMSSLLHGPGTTTFAVVVLDQQQLGDPTVTSALGVLLTLVVLVAALPLVFMRRALPTLFGGR